MLARIRKSMDEKDQGFTLIELLVVMIIIGILAAIAVPVFLSQRAKARDTATKSDVTAIGKELASFYVDGGINATVTATYTAAAGTTPGQVALASGAPAVTFATVKLSSGTVAPTAPILTLNYSTDTTKCTKSTGWFVALTDQQGSTPTWYYSAQYGLSSTAPAAGFVCS